TRQRQIRQRHRDRAGELHLPGKINVHPPTAPPRDHGAQPRRGVSVDGAKAHGLRASATSAASSALAAAFGSGFGGLPPAPAAPGFACAFAAGFGFGGLYSWNLTVTVAPPLPSCTS